MYKYIPEIYNGVAALPLLMAPSNRPEPARNRSEPPLDPDPDHESPGPGEPVIPSHPLTVVEAKQARRSGRGIRRLITLCGTITQLVAEYDHRLLASESDTNSDGDGDEDGGNKDNLPERKEEARR